MKGTKTINNRRMFYVFVLMLACFFVLSAVMPVLAYGSEEVGLESSDAVSGTPFSVENMFPGDSVVKEYIVSVSHKEAITLYYHADIRAGYDVLAEVLKTKIELTDKSVTLYDGLMRDMPPALAYPLAGAEDTLRYRITVYLDTSVGGPSELDPDGKRYMNRELLADFHWWYFEEEESGEPVPAYLKLTAEKTLNGKHPKGNDFTFLLSDAEYNTVQTKRNNGGLVEFDSIRFDAPGVYTFYMTEKDEGKKQFSYDDSVYCVTVVITEQDGVLAPSVSYSKGGNVYIGTPLFANTRIGAIPQTGDDALLGLRIGLFGSALLILVFITIAVLNKRKQGRGE